VTPAKSPNWRTVLQAPVSAFILLAGATGAWPAEAEPQLLDRIVAVIDEEVILWSELSLRVRMELQHEGRGAYLTPAALDERLDRTLDAMIDERVLVLKAQEDSIEVESSQVEEILNSQLDQIHASMDQQDYDALLERSGMSERRLKARYRKEIRHQLLYEQMTSMLAYRQFITRRQTDAFREAHRDSLPAEISVSQISVEIVPEPAVLDRSREKIQRIQQRLEAGESFEDVARDISEDTRTAPDGGDLGCFQPGFLAPEFERAAMQLRPGQVGGPVHTPLGYHLILLQERREDALCCSHILVRAPTTDADRLRAFERLEELRRRSLAGEEFAQLARDHSENESTASRGGLWQIMSRDQIPPELHAFIGGLGLGGISDPFAAEGFAHILKINDDQATVESLVRQSQLAGMVEELIEEFKGEIHVEKRLEDKYLWSPQAAAAGDASS